MSETVRFRSFHDVECNLDRFIRLKRYESSVEAFKRPLSSRARPQKQSRNHRITTWKRLESVSRSTMEGFSIRFFQRAPRTSRKSQVGLESSKGETRHCWPRYLITGWAFVEGGQETLTWSRILHFCALLLACSITEFGETTQYAVFRYKLGVEVERNASAVPEHLRFRGFLSVPVKAYVALILLPSQQSVGV